MRVTYFSACAASVELTVLEGIYYIRVVVTSVSFTVASINGLLCWRASLVFASVCCVDR